MSAIRRPREDTVIALAYSVEKAIRVIWNPPACTAIEMRFSFKTSWLWLEMLPFVNQASGA